MIILEEPYVSKFLLETIQRLNIPVLQNEAIEKMKITAPLHFLSPEKFISQYQKNPNTPLYSSSENALDWVVQNLKVNRLPQKIQYFKDKFHFRELVKNLYPNFKYFKTPFSQLKSFDLSKLSFPVIIKPNIGFFSVGVYKVNSAKEWNSVNDLLINEMNNIKGIFPSTVVDSAEFIIEDCIEGDEYAVDVYFDDHSQPVILNIMKHIFASPEDTSDRLYITSKEIIESTYDIFNDVLSAIGNLAQIPQFPMHIEFRKDDQNQVGIIEANSLRFAGLCVTDLAYFAYGSNNYELFFNNLKPDWKSLLQGKEGKIYAMIVGTIPKSLKLEEIESVDYEAFCKRLSNVLECREMDVHKIPLFTITFAAFDESTKNEMEWALKSDFQEFFKLKSE